MFISVLKVFLGREFGNGQRFGRGSDFPDGVLDGHEIWKNVRKRCLSGSDRAEGPNPSQPGASPQEPDQKNPKGQRPALSGQSQT